MEHKLVRRKLYDNVFFSSVQDPKFKHNRITVDFVMPLEEKYASDNAVVPLILRKGSAACPDFTALNQKLSMLYGAVLGADVVRHGGEQILHLSVRVIDDRFAPGGEKLIEACTDLLADVILTPNMPGGLFPERDVRLERQFVLDSIDAEINDKRAYAARRCIELMYAGLPAAVSAFGSREQAQKITSAGASEAYNRIMQKARIEIFFTGCGDPAASAEVFSRRFSGLKRPAFDFVPYTSEQKRRDVQEKTERMELSQAKLVMGLRTGHIMDERTAAALRLMTALYGGTPFSRLFLNVREKMSLCYYCSARYDRPLGHILVESGVEAENKDKAYEEILNQLRVIRTGAFGETEIENTKLLLNTSLRSTGDSLGGIEAWYLAKILEGEQTSPEEMLSIYASITKQDVMDVASRVVLDTVYFLTGGKEEQI